MKGRGSVLSGPTFWIVFAALMLLTCMTRTALGRNAPDIAGTWQGTLQVGGGQRVVVKISKMGSTGAEKAEKSAWKAVYYNFDSHADGLGKLATSTKFEDQSLQFAVASIDASYAGKLSPDDASIAGTWTQANVSHPLTLQRANGDTAWEIPGADRDMPPDASPEFEVATIKPVPPTGTAMAITSTAIRSCDTRA